jgi:hypothetical protein
VTVEQFCVPVLMLNKRLTNQKSFSLVLLLSKEEKLKTSNMRRLQYS